MAGLTTLRLKWMRAIGKMPSAVKIEARQRAAERLYGRCQAFMQSTEYKRYRELSDLVLHGDVDRVREECSLTSFSGSQEESMLADLKRLSSSKEVRDALKGGGNTQSPDYARYQELRAKVEAPEFQERVAFLKDKNRFYRTPEGKAYKEYESLCKSKELQWFLKQEKSGTVARMQAETDGFYDTFDGTRLDPRWSTRFFWGDALLGKAYSFMGDPHAYTDGKNVRIEHGCLVIETRREECEALAWDNKLGFLPKHFDYTSGVVTTGQSFRLKHGVFEAKLRFTAEPGVYHAFYLAGDSAVPQVDVFRSMSDNPKMISALYTARPQSTEASASVGTLPFSSEFFILGVEWSSSSIVWKINGVPYLEVTNHLPEHPLYVVFASGVVPGSEPQGVSRLEVDWIRCMAQ